MKWMAIFWFVFLTLTGCSGEVEVESTGTSTSTLTSVGSGGSGGESGSGGSGAGVLEASDRTSCADKNLTCAEGHSCCAATFVPGGSYNRLNDPLYPATVSSFWLDMFEVTVGRMRSFVEAYPGSSPAPGAGAHPKVPESGWKASTSIPKTQVELEEILAKDSTPDELTPFLAWTSDIGSNENRPISRVNWNLAQAFCIWDGGRLPTEAEWNYAAVGGDEQRTYPWGEDLPTPELAVLNYNGPEGPYEMGERDVGSVPAGAARWGQLDLSGGRTEILFDANLAECCDVSELPMPCDNCLVINENGEEGRRVHDQSAFHMANVEISNEEQGKFFYAKQVAISVGFRCVYSPPTPP